MYDKVIEPESLILVDFEEYYNKDEGSKNSGIYTTRRVWQLKHDLVLPDFFSMRLLQMFQAFMQPGITQRMLRNFNMEESNNGKE